MGRLSAPPPNVCKVRACATINRSISFRSTLSLEAWILAWATSSAPHRMTSAFGLMPWKSGHQRDRTAAPHEAGVGLVGRGHCLHRSLDCRPVHLRRERVADPYLLNLDVNPHGAAFFKLSMSRPTSFAESAPGGIRIEILAAASGITTLAASLTVGGADPDHRGGGSGP